MKRFVIVAATATAVFVLSSAENGIEKNTIATTTTEGRTITVTALGDNVIKVTNAAAGETIEESKVTVMQPEEFTGIITHRNGYDAISTPSGLKALLNLTTGAVEIDGGINRKLIDNGIRSTDSIGRKSLTLFQTGQAYYGAGERGHRFNLYGDTLTMYNRQNYGYTEGDPRISQMNISMPLLVAAKGYALLFDDYAESEMIVGDTLTYSTIRPSAISYYFVNSPTGMAGVPEQLSALTGRQPLPPLWSLGYITSKYGYKTQQETDSVVSTLKSYGYPLDGIVLDLYWYGQEEDMGRLAWDSDQWPNHRAMLDKLKKKGVNLVAISQPYVVRNGRGIDNYNELAAKGMFGKDQDGNVREVKIWIGEGGMLDVSNEDTRQWLRERYRTLTDEGITGWWGDLGEPEVHPDSMYHANGLTTRQYHNLYGNDWSRIISDLFKEEYPATRLMTLMRGGTTGLQRYSVFPWSTDVSRSWGGLQPQVKIMLNSGLSGLGYMSHDAGGFAVDKQNPVDSELYLRWLQLGLFSPVFRTHSTVQAEPYTYEGHLQQLLPIVKERYKWLPYNYTLAWENASAGMPLVRPVGMYSPEPAAYSDIEDQYLWGRDVMIAPVMKPGATSRTVRFPEGVWVDYNNPSKTIEGGTSEKIETPLELLPVYVRAGALITHAPYSMENTGDFRSDTYTVNYYPTPGCGMTSTVVFEDDHTSPTSIENGQYALLSLSANNTPSSIRLTAGVEGSYPGIPASRSLTFEIHNIDTPANISSPAQIIYTYDNATRNLTISVAAWNPAHPLTIDIAK